MQLFLVVGHVSRAHKKRLPFPSNAASPNLKPRHRRKIGMLKNNLQGRNYDFTTVNSMNFYVGSSTYSRKTSFLFQIPAFVTVMVRRLPLQGISTGYEPVPKSVQLHAHTEVRKYLISFSGFPRLKNSLHQYPRALGQKISDHCIPRSYKI